MDKIIKKCYLWLVKWLKNKSSCCISVFTLAYRCDKCYGSLKSWIDNERCFKFPYGSRKIAEWGL